MKISRLPTLRHRRFLPAALCLFLAAAPGCAHAAFTLTVTQVGGNVVINGSGSINFSALSLYESGGTNVSFEPSTAGLDVGATGTGNISV